MTIDDRGVEGLVEEVKKKQAEINKFFEDEIKEIKKGHVKTETDVINLTKKVENLTEEVNGNVKNILDSNMIIRNELTKYTDYLLTDRRESERREEEAKLRAEEDRRESERREYEAKLRADEAQEAARKRAEEIKNQTRTQWFKVVGTVVGSNVFMYVIQSLLG